MITMSHEEQKNYIMRRVRFIFRVRQFVTPVTVKVAFVAVLAVVGSAFVSVQSVLLNMPSVENVSEFLRFLSSAFVKTEFIVQAVVLATALIGVLVLRDLIRNVRNVRGSAPFARVRAR